MKNFYISVTVFLSIVVFGLCSNYFVNKFNMDITTDIENYKNITEFSENDIDKINNTKEKFFNQKDMLQLFINKEHIQDLEEDILMIEDAVKSNNADSCRESTISALSSLAFLKESIFAVD